MNKQMADRLIFKGGTTVTNHSGNSLQFMNPARGRSLHRFPRWWNKKPSVVYVDCAIFRVTFNDGSVYRLVIPASGQGHILEIRHDGNGNFTFPVSKNIERCALVAEFGTKLFVEYQFSKISGGSVLKRTVTEFPRLLQFEEPPVIKGELVEKERVTLYPAQYTGGVDIATVRSCLQTKNNDKWSDGEWDESQSAIIYVLNQNEAGKTLRYVTQVIDFQGIHQSFSPEVGPVRAHDLIPELIEEADQTYIVTVDSNDDDEDVFFLNDLPQPLIEFTVGQTVVFDLRDPSYPGSGLAIYTDSDKTIQVTVGIESNEDYLIFTPPITGTFSYQSSNGSAVGGDITVSALQTENSQ